VRSQRDDGRLLYQALISRQTYVAGKVETLVDRLFEGDPQKLAAYLSRG
jgi:predicted transcriptional regulator